VLGGAQPLHLARELGQAHVPERYSVVQADLGGQVDHVEVIVDRDVEYRLRGLGGLGGGGHDRGDVVSDDVGGHEAELNVSVRGHAVLDHEGQQADDDVGVVAVSGRGGRDE